MAFPGGHLDENENDFQASIREVKEEIGLDLLEINALYLGKLPSNFYVRKRKDKTNLMLNVHLFFIFEENINFKIQEKEV